MITVNEYFGGAVKSLAYQSSDGKSSIGVIETGEFEFGTSTHETMHIIEGALDALLPGENEWKTFHAGQSFEVPANTSFKVQSAQQTSYLCKYR